MKNKFVVVITRAESQSERLQQLLQESGFDVFLLPAIKIGYLRPTAQALSIIKQLNNAAFDWIVFTSVNGVRGLAAMQSGITIPPAIRVAAVGRKTAAALSEVFARDPDLVPAKADAGSLLGELSPVVSEKSRVLLVTGSKNTELLHEGLLACGAAVEKLCVYKSSANPDAASGFQSLSAIPADKLIFTFFSPSAVKSVLGLGREGRSILNQAQLVSIGPVTSECLKTEGFSNIMEAEAQHEDSLVALLTRRFK